jgi:hypothetical protein
VFCLSKKSIFVTAFGLIAVLALGLGLSAELWVGPVRAQEPENGVEYIELDSPSISPKDWEVEYEALPSSGGVQIQQTSLGYLRIITLDLFNGRPMPSYTYRIYDQNGADVATVTSDCTGAVQLDSLATGYYRVDPQYSEGDRYYAYGSYSYVFVGAGYRASLRYYTRPMFRLAGIRVNAYDRYAGGFRGFRGYLEGVPVSIYDSTGTLAFSGVTNCSGFEDFFEAAPGWYRIVAGPDSGPQGTPPPGTPGPQDTPTPTPAVPPAPGTGVSSHVGLGEMWVLVYPGYLVSVDLYLDSSTFPQVTVTPTPDATAVQTPTPGATQTPNPGSPTATTVPPTATPSPTRTPTPLPSPTPTATEPVPPPPPPI